MDSLQLQISALNLDHMVKCWQHCNVAHTVPTTFHDGKSVYLCIAKNTQHTTEPSHSFASHGSSITRQSSIHMATFAATAFSVQI